MALTRARAIVGEPSLLLEIDRSLERILIRPHGSIKLISDARDMRDLIRKQHPGTNFWDLKHRPGGMVDIDFIAQCLTLRHADQHPAILRRDAVAMLEALSDEGLIQRVRADKLCRAQILWRNLQQLMRLLVPGDTDDSRWREHTKRRLALAGDCPDFSTLTDLVREMAEGAASEFREIFAIDETSRE